jgi:hypothetical protein
LPTLQPIPFVSATCKGLVRVKLPACRANLGSALNAKRREQVADLRLDGVDRNVVAVGYLTIGQAAADFHEYPS